MTTFEKFKKMADLMEIVGPTVRASAAFFALATFEGEPTVSDIAARAGMSLQVTSRFINALVDEGLVSKRPHPTEYRATLLTLTASGRALRNRFTAAIEE